LEGLQRLLLRRASLVTTVSPPLQSSLQKLTADAPVEVIYNGHDGFLPLTVPRRSEKIVRIVHAGTIYKKYNPAPWLQAIRELIDEDLYDAERFELCFLGDKLSNFASLLEEYSLAKIAIMPGQVSREEAQAAQRNATLLLLIGSNDPGILHGKLFEYLAACRPILAIGDTQDSDSGKLLQHTRCGIAVGADVRQIREVLQCLAEGSELPFSQPDFNDLATYSRENQSKKLESLLVSLVPMSQQKRPHTL
jgi:glycosyltransferase involved in cell wall biosynthesis